MKTTFELALDHVLAFEGGYSDHKDDPGGKTYRGITIETLRRYRNGVPVTEADLKALTFAEIKAIYRWGYWNPAECDELPPEIAIMVFDAAVNSGPKNAVIALQRALKDVAGFGLNMDGVIGPKTLAAVHAVKDRMALLRRFFVRRIVFYGMIATFKTFGLGWITRVVAGYETARDFLLSSQKELAA